MNELCMIVGMNYVDHCLEQNLPVPKEPVVFCKFANAITDPGAPILLENTQVSQRAFRLYCTVAR